MYFSICYVAYLRIYVITDLMNTTIIWLNSIVHHEDCSRDQQGSYKSLNTSICLWLHVFWKITYSSFFFYKPSVYIFFSKKYKKNIHELASAAGEPHVCYTCWTQWKCATCMHYWLAAPGKTSRQKISEWLFR